MPGRVASIAGPSELETFLMLQSGPVQIHPGTAPKAIASGPRSSRPIPYRRRRSRPQVRRPDPPMHPERNKSARLDRLEVSGSQCTR